MDNLTHSIIGFGVGELAHRSLPPETDPARQRTRHRLLLVACALANNFPDLDLFLTHGLPPPLSYLMYHRGQTHTALMAIPQALLLAALLWLCWPAARALLKTCVAARIGLAVTVPLGLALHLLMDYTNSYGIHPFYPLDGRWVFGGRAVASLAADGAACCWRWRSALALSDCRARPRIWAGSGSARPCSASTRPRKCWTWR